MTVFEHWENQKMALAEQLKNTSSLADAAYQVRHALLQTEQNALAEMTDDVLRQQAGVLMGGLKNAVGLLEASIASQVWVPQKQKDKPQNPRRLPTICLAALLLLLIGYGYVKGFWLVALASAAALALALLMALIKPAPISQDEVRVTLKPDTNRLFAILDGQLRAIDRYVNDFVYLNDQLRSGAKTTSGAALSRAADLMEALYECDEAEREPAEDAARRLLLSLGLEAVNYSAENSRLFNALPSKTVTRTLSPAILSASDRTLLRRGTAAVQNGAA